MMKRNSQNPRNPPKILYFVNAASVFILVLPNFISASFGKSSYFDFKVCLMKGSFCDDALSTQTNYFMPYLKITPLVKLESDVLG